MNPLSIISELVRRIKLNWSMRSVYRGTFISTASWKTERGLTAMLCAGVGLMVIAAGLHIQAMFFGIEAHTREALAKNIQPPPLLTATIATQQALPEVSFTGSRAHTLFQLAKYIVEAPSPAEHKPLETRAHKAETTVRNTMHWQLQVQRPPVSGELLVSAIADAGKHLQSGNVALARQAYLAVLTQDTHNVEAMEGMLVIARQLRDTQSEQTYLERLRQEIPDYDDSNVLGTNVSLVSIQDWPC